ncbi:hypothetical protein Glove_142g59 [Diversispora epigaea]|uniref:Uncharacterized protein n=1 Tax=Diversispora epigaea TaxID=1348612 RepID=A0A397J3K7_9GLOM|nr:hypothetical protein Glove_142g59 [Diversispora epigaea]
MSNYKENAIDENIKILCSVTVFCNRFTIDGRPKGSKGPKGPKEPKGPEGPEGPKGPKGPKN